MKKTALLFCWVALVPWLSGCIPVVVTAGASTAGVVAAQERSSGNAMDDAGIKLTIDNLFFQRDINDLFKNVNVQVSEGRVLLTGAVVKPETKDEATKLAWRARGVREIINEIQANGGIGIVDYARDTWISAQVRSRLLVEKDVRSVNYNVETVNGVVYLLGIAQNEDELKKVTYLASTTRYVKQVVSHVIMKDDPRRRPYGMQGATDTAPSGHENHPVPGGHMEQNDQPIGEAPVNGPDDGGGQPETRSHMSQPE